MTAERPFKLGIVAGERSGERLAADVVHALRNQLDRDVTLVGIGGDELAGLGLKSLFDAQEIALMGISQVAASLPRLIRRIGQTADHFTAEKPDCVLLVDSPDFSHRVAKKLKAVSADVPVVKYVAPTVWAWRPARAAKMVGTIDAVMALFPFEPQVMADLGGPPTTYVGHPLAADEGLTAVRQQRMKAPQQAVNDRMRLLLLAGSRKTEIESLTKDMRAVVDDLIQAGITPEVRMPTVARHERLLRRLTADWPMTPLITTDRDAQLAAYQWADCAVCASGTVTLELAIASVPAVSLYRTDLMARPLRSLLTVWTAALPNLIADRQVIPEYFDEVIRSGMVMRLLREMADPSSHRHRMMMEGYAEVIERMTIDEDPAQIAARVILDTAAAAH